MTFRRILANREIFAQAFIGIGLLYIGLLLRCQRAATIIYRFTLLGDIHYLFACVYYGLISICRCAYSLICVWFFLRGLMFFPLASANGS